MPLQVFKEQTTWWDVFVTSNKMKKENLVTCNYVSWYIWIVMDLCISQLNFIIFSLWRWLKKRLEFFFFCLALKKLFQVNWVWFYQYVLYWNYWHLLKWYLCTWKKSWLACPLVCQQALLDGSSSRWRIWEYKEHMHMKIIQWSVSI